MTDAGPPPPRGPVSGTEGHSIMSATLLRAPHRVMFLTGMIVLAGASLWWTIEIVARHGQSFVLPAPTLPPLFAHSWLMLYGLFPCFMAGFLYTAGPRWLATDEVPIRTALLTGIAFVVGFLLWTAGLYLGDRWLLAAAFAVLTGWLTLTASVMRMLVAAARPAAHAVAIATALAVGCAGIVIFGLGIAGHNGMMMHLAVRIGLWGALLPVFYTVCHRMLPFFAQSVVPAYEVVRPVWLLVAVVGLCWLRLAAGVLGWLEAQLVIDATLFLLTAWNVVLWQSWKARSPTLLGTLFVAFLFLPLAIMLQTIRDLGYVMTGEWWLGRAPIHALGMGFMAGLAIAMVTRVTLGHSGRPLVMPRAVLGCFVLVVTAALIRVLAEVAGPGAHYAGMLITSLLLWLAGVLSWASLLVPIYLQPRIDGRPG